MTVNLHLHPPAPAASSLTAALSPYANSIALAPSPALSTITTASNGPSGKHNQQLYVAQYDSERIERRALIVDAYTLFASLQVSLAFLLPSADTRSGLD
jgi:hypothetical protein